MSECQELKPCPFCGCENISIKVGVYRNGDTSIVECEDCNGGIETPDDAVAIWNSRPVEDELRAEIEKLESALVDMMKLGINRVKDLRAENDALKAALRALVKTEYVLHYNSVEDVNEGYCPHCHRAKYVGEHHPDCPWVAAGKLLEEE